MPRQENHHRASAVGEVGIARQVVPRTRFRCRSYAAAGAQTRAIADRHLAGHDIVARFVDVDLVCREIPGLEREPNADVAADLADPGSLALEGMRGAPQRQIDALGDVRACPLQSDVLLLACDIEGADRRVAVFRIEQERLRYHEARLERDRFHLIPARPERLPESEFTHRFC